MINVIFLKDKKKLIQYRMCIRRKTGESRFYPSF